MTGPSQSDQTAWTEAVSRVHLSFGELHFHCCRAAFGAGLPWGLAEDAAQAAVWLAQRGHDPAPMLAPALRHLADRTVSTCLKHERTGATLVLAADGATRVSALAAGPSAADWWQVVKHDPAARLVVRHVDVPGWVSACIAARTGDLETGALQAVTPGEVAITADLAGDWRQDVSPTATFATVGRDSWGIVQECFRLSLVASTDASRSAGAGAGLVDTD